MIRDRRARFVAAAGGALCVIGLIGFLGWVLELDALRAVLPGAAAINPLSTVCFVAFGIALMRLSRRDALESPDPLATALVALTAIAAVTRVVAYLGGPDAGLDQVLFHAALDDFEPPNRMPPNTAAAFVACAAALLLVRARDLRAVVAGQIAALAAGVVGIVTLWGYAFGLASLMGPSRFIPMSLPTGIGLAVGAAGILMTRADAGIVRDAAAPTPGGQVFRRVAPVAVLLPPVLAWLVVHGLGAGILDEAVAITVAVIVGTLLIVVLLASNARRLNRAEARRLESEKRTREALRDLSRKSAELAAANAELESFSYSVSHDLRAPLRSITSFSQILLEDHGTSLDADARAHLDRIVRAGGRMSQLIDDLIALARVSRGTLERAEVDVSAIAAEVVEELRAAEPGRAVDARVQPGLEVWADPQLLRVVLTNLVSNAWKYTGKVDAPRIEVGALPRAGSGGTNAAALPGTAEAGSVAVVDPGPIVFFVRDNGVGFDMQYADRLFTPFQRLHRVEEFAGTGVGLATVRRVVNRHGGRVWAEAAPDAGATFYFTLNPGNEA